MAARFRDSFDHYVSADTPTKYTNSSLPIVTAGAGRRGTACMRFTSGGSFVTKTLDAQSTWIMGAAVKFQNLGGGSFFALLDAGTLQVDLRINTDGTLSVTRNGTVLGTTTFSVLLNVYYFIELKVFINNTTGTAEVRIDNTTRLSLTSQDTQNTANATANQVELSNTGSANQTEFDDYYVLDGTGSAPNNDFLGDIRVDAKFPSAVGNTTQLTRGGTDSGANWSQVEETAPNADTDYNEHATVGNKDTYVFEDLTHTPVTIFSASVLAYAKKDDAGAKGIILVTRSTTDFDSASQALATGYAYYEQIRELDPNTSAAWTLANLNAAEFGVKVAA